MRFPRITVKEDALAAEASLTQGGMGQTDGQLH
jgi:hypothetical protein